jgi:hypothetical protein
VRGTRQALAPFVRYEHVDTQADVPSGFPRNAALDQQIYTVGFSYLPIDRVAIKADYRNYQSQGGTPPADVVSLGLGFVY